MLPVATEYKRTSEITDARRRRPAVDLPRPHDAAQGGPGAGGHAHRAAPRSRGDVAARHEEVAGPQPVRIFVYYRLRTPDVRARIQRAGSGTSSTMKKITQKDVMGLPFPVKTGLAEQRAAVEELDEIVSRIDAAWSTQQSAAQDLSALMPAMLDRAFQGELDADRVSSDARAA